MKRQILFLLLCINLYGNSQERFTLSGTVFENQGNETLIGANIIIDKLKTGTISNEYGFYSITLAKGVYELTISNIGYSTIKKTIILDKDIIKDFTLSEATEALDEVLIETNIESLNIRTPQMSVNSLTASSIKQIPVVFGEADVIKAITLLPGVSSGGEGAAGFNVRGGAADQNLILLDEATIFNSSHLFGLFSVFNPDAIKSLKLYKGGVPAKYGGRVASVLDIYQKEGNKNEFKANGGVGLVASRLLLEGPLKKGVGSFLLGGRATYAHLFLPLFDVNNIAYFYDLNTKLSYKLNKKNSIYLSAYFGRDVFNVSNSFENTYGNTVVNFRLNHLFNDKLFSNLSLIYSDYYYGLNLNFVGFEWNSGIQNMNIKYDFNQYVNDRYKLEYGLHSTYYRFNPGVIGPNRPDSGINTEALTNKFAFENAIYLDIKHQLYERLTVSYGSRLSSFLRLGQKELNLYENNQAVGYNMDLQLYEEINPIGSESISTNKVIKSFLNLEPRLAISYKLDDNTSLKTSYNRMTQYLHLISNTSSPTPLDVWTPSGKYIQPQILDQIAIGYFKRYNKYDLEIESFYKKTKNRIDYIDGANLIANKAIEQVLLNGQSRAYGFELLFRKNKGRFKGWFAYTLSKSEQQTKGLNASEPGINNGKWYNTPYDKTHDISITSSYDLNNKWKLNANFIYQTGQPTTYPNGQYEYNNLIVSTFESRNSSRLDAYHRFDISGTYIPKKSKDKQWKGEWVFSIYNLYNRKNTQSLNFRENQDTGQNEALKLSLFGAIGAVSYNFKF
ncbi:MAG: TonB-dependent receptor [Flavobacteriaceae bacterium]|nr:TonB-dependent receptor [Flavobacteriaceae bacterium]